jgi:hypothetical protein
MLIVQTSGCFQETSAQVLCVILSEARLRAQSQGAAESARRGLSKDLEVS